MAEINALGDFAATVEEIRVDLKEPNTTAALDRIRFFVCRAIERHRRERFKWMRHNWTLALKNNVSSYSLDGDFDIPMRSVEGKWAYLLKGGATPTYDIERKTPSEVFGKLRSTTQYRGNPQIFCVEGSTLTLDPEPSNMTGDLLTGRGFKKIESPTRSLVSGAWNFSPGTFTNEWFTEGAELLNAYVRYKMQAGPLSAHDDASVAAGEYEEIKREMQIETEEEEMPTEVTPWPRF